MITGKQFYAIICVIFTALFAAIDVNCLMGYLANPDLAKIASQHFISDVVVYTAASVVLGISAIIIALAPDK